MAKDKIKLELKKITKKFGENIANNNISIKIKEGSIHAIAGENGAGKSTLMNMIFGLIQPTSGKIFLDGKEIKVKNAHHANDLKIGMVHQHFKLVDIFTGLENIILGQEPTKGKYILDRKHAKKIIEKNMEEFDLRTPLDIPVENMTVGQEQKLEIIKLLYRESEILIFDEPTAVLTPDEIKKLITTIKKFKAKGKTIIIITHKLDEIQQLADDITVLRHGEIVDSFTKKELTPARLSKAIVGKKIDKIKKKATKPGKAIFSLEKINVDKIGFKNVPALQNVSLKVHAGEILAIAGVEGNGQKELSLITTGMLKPKSGKIHFMDENITDFNAQQLYRMGMSHIPEDRQHHGLLMEMPLVDNAVIQDIDIVPFSTGHRINRDAFAKKANEIIKSYDVRGAKKPKSALASSLSGGNQQKFVVGREIMRKNNKFLMITQPTRGLDIGSISYIHQEILKAKESGRGVLLVSYELSEVIALADRVLVINEGNIVGELTKNQITKEKIGTLLTGKGKGKN